MRPNQLVKAASPSSKRKRSLMRCQFETQAFLDALPAILIGAHIGVLLSWKDGSTQRMRRGQTPTLPCYRGTQWRLIEIVIGKSNAVSDGSGRRRYPLGVAVDPWQRRGAAGSANVKETSGQVNPAVCFAGTAVLIGSSPLFPDGY